MITCEIYRSGVLRRSWKYRFVGANGEKFGHQYNDLGAARESVARLMDPDTAVTLRVRHRDGTIADGGRIR